MSNDLFKRVLYNDGEGLTHTDFNNEQLFLAAQVQDGFLEKYVATPSSATLTEFVSANAETSWAYCLDVCGALPIAGTGNNKIKISAGTLFQKIANATGNSPTFVAYTFDGTTELTIANGSAVNPRVDLIQMKLEYENGDPQSRDFEDAVTHVVTTTSQNKQYRVKATVSVKTGVVAASPAYPTPDAGYVPICAIVVGTNYVGATAWKTEDTAGAVAVVHDLRMPLKMRPIVVRHPEFIYYSGDGWTTPANDLQALIGGATDFHKMFAACPEVKCRLLGVRVRCFQDTDPADCTVAKNTVDVTDHEALYDATDITSLGAGQNGNNLFQTVNQSAFFVAGPTVTGNGTHDVPVWGNGKRCYDKQTGGLGNTPATAELDQVGVAISQATDFAVYGVTFYIAQ